MTIFRTRLGHAARVRQPIENKFSRLKNFPATPLKLKYMICHSGESYVGKGWDGPTDTHTKNCRLNRLAFRKNCQLKMG